MNKNVKNPRGGADKRMILNNRAFTLIELLVVVLIIGILAAIALPQYTKAVEKSRAAEAMIAIKAIGEAARRYQLQTGTSTMQHYSAIKDSLDIEMADLKNFSIGSITHGYGQPKNLRIYATRSYKPKVTPEDMKYSIEYTVYSESHPEQEGRIYCIAPPSNKTATSICKSLGSNYGVYVLDSSYMSTSL
ncbi:prepilin-type N-terminal cleavage/methylation domain-containing protein [Elusimicrobium posterum]|uniref:type IV pilin protein n=1 Tax=Elusimicrobium posterum TaxID=3116653 RepID=UPI003C74D197